MKPRKLKDDWQGRGSLRRLASWLNAVAAILNNLRAVDGLSILPNRSGGYDFAVLPTSQAWPFRCSRVFVGGKCFTAASDWTGTGSNYLAVYFDGTTPPAYIAKATFDAAVANGMPADCEYYDLAQTPGDIHVPRA